MSCLRQQKLFELMQDTMGMQCFPRATHIAHYLLQAAEAPGAVVEFGSHEGRTAAFMTALTDKPVFVYDSFEGLPEPSVHDKPSDVFHAGAMALDVAKLTERFKRSGLRQPTVVAKFFRDLEPGDLPNQIAFAHLDGDFYESIADSLNLVWPRLADGGYMIVDDWGWEQLPGVYNAVRDFCREYVLDPVPLMGPDGKCCNQVLFSRPSSVRVFP